MYFRLKKNLNLTHYLILISVVLKIFVVFYFGDTKLDNEWGLLLYNFKNFGIIGINIFDGSEVYMGKATLGEMVLPSVYMPPFYLFFIIVLNTFFSDYYLVLSILISQILISTISSLLFFKLLKKFYDLNISILGFCLFLFFPLNIYATSQISSITIQVFFNICFFYYIFQLIDKEKFSNIFYLSIISSCLIFLRGEFVLTLLFSHFFLIYKKKKLKIFFVTTLITLLFISPYLVRNFKLFNEITITKSLGFNLWKGNNFYSFVEGNEKVYDLNMIKNLEKIEPNNNYEINRDKIYKDNAIKNITSSPIYYFSNYLKKFFALLVFDTKSTYNNYYNFLHVIPKIILGITTLLGVLGVLTLRLRRENLLYFIFIYFLNISIFSSFFVLPRYSLALLPIQIVLSCSFFNLIYQRFK